MSLAAIYVLHRILCPHWLWLYYLFFSSIDGFMLQTLRGFYEPKKKKNFVMSLLVFLPLFSMTKS